MENFIVSLTPYLYTCSPTTKHIVNHWLTGVLMGGVSGEYASVLNTSPHRHISIRGINNHDITLVSVYIVGCFYHSQAVPVIIIMHQYAYHGKGKTIHSYAKLDWYKNDVNDKSRKVNCGEQRILTTEGCIFTLVFTRIDMYYYATLLFNVVGHITP